MLTEDGLCFTFNMLDKTELLRNKVYVGYFLAQSAHKNLLTKHGNVFFSTHFKILLVAKLLCTRIN